MKQFIVATVAVLSTVALAIPGIPDGVYEGQGRMKTAKGLDRVYAAKLTLKDSGMVADYDYGGGQLVSYSATIEATSALEFRILDTKKTEIGKGYCDSALCHLDIPGDKAEESWFLDGTKLVRVGSMLHGDDKLIYTETLALKKDRLAGEKMILECEGFEHSDTKLVRVFRATETEGSLVEIKTNGAEVKRALSGEELAKSEYAISPIFGMDRVIVQKAGAWVLSYSCGEDRPLVCRFTP